MHIFNNLKNFLYDNSNFIAIFDNKIYLYNIDKVNLLTDSNAIISFKNKTISIKGSDLKTFKYYNKELILDGNIESVSLK